MASLFKIDVGNIECYVEDFYNSRNNLLGEIPTLYGGDCHFKYQNSIFLSYTEDLFDLGLQTYLWLSYLSEGDHLVKFSMFASGTENPTFEFVKNEDQWQFFIGEDVPGLKYIQYSLNTPSIPHDEFIRGLYEFVEIAQWRLKKHKVASPFTFEEFLIYLKDKELEEKSWYERVYEKSFLPYCKGIGPRPAYGPTI